MRTITKNDFHKWAKTTALDLVINGWDGCGEMPNLTEEGILEFVKIIPQKFKDKVIQWIPSNEPFDQDERNADLIYHYCYIWIEQYHYYYKNIKGVK